MVAHPFFAMAGLVPAILTFFALKRNMWTPGDEAPGGDGGQEQKAKARGVIPRRAGVPAHGG